MAQCCFTNYDIMDKEDGEMSDDNAMLVDHDDPVHPTPKTKITTEDRTVVSAVQCILLKRPFLV